MDANLLTFSGSAAVALFAAFLSWGRGLKSCGIDGARNILRDRALPLNCVIGS